MFNKKSLQIFDSLPIRLWEVTNVARPNFLDVPSTRILHKRYSSKSGHFLKKNYEKLIKYA